MRAKKSVSSGSGDGDREEVALMPVSKRESLLVEAWKRRKRGLLHHRHQHLSRSSSDSVADQLMFITGGRSSSSHGSFCSSENGRAKSLTDDDFEELRGCIDLGFRFHHSSISDLCNTLPALHVCSAISQTHHEPSSGSSPFSSSFSSMAMASSSSFSSSPDGSQRSPSVDRSSSWTIFSPGHVFMNLKCNCNKMDHILPACCISRGHAAYNQPDIAENVKSGEQRMQRMELLHLTLIHFSAEHHLVLTRISFFAFFTLFNSLLGKNKIFKEITHSMYACAPCR